MFSMFIFKERFEMTWKGYNQLAHCTVLQKVSKCEFKDTQCENLKIFVSLKFYVKSILRTPEVQKLQKLPILRAGNLVHLVNFRLRKVAKSIKIKIQSL